jgi:hypothetical protein
LIPHSCVNFKTEKMRRHYAYTNAELNSPLQQKGNETMPTIKLTQLKANSHTVIANKVDGPTARDAIAMSVGKKYKKKDNKPTKEIENKNIRSAKQDDNYGASNIVLPCPGS